MKLLRSITMQFRASWTAIKLILVMSAVLLSTVLFLHHWKSIPIRSLTGDPVSISGDPVYVGFLSQVGIFLWAAAAAICFFSAKVLPQRSDCFRIKRFLVISGALTLLLGLDDVFLLHEHVFPVFGIPEKVVFIFYAGCLIAYLIRQYLIILKTQWILLGMALTCFGTSIALDLWQPAGIDPYLLEDGTKLVGIGSWLVYFYQTAATAIAQSTVQQPLVPERPMITVEK